MHSKKLFLARYEILGLLVKKLTSDYVYSRNNTDKSPLPIQMQLTGKLQTFSLFFIAILQLALNFKHFEIKDEPHGYSISEVIDSERRF